MNLQDLAQIKAELLCYGVRLDSNAREKGIIKNSYLFDGGFVHAAHFLVGEIVVNTCVSEKFCEDSPYEITWEDDRALLSKNGAYLCDIEILPLPKWCLEKIDGHEIGDYLRPHSLSCISCCPKLKCTYFKDGQQCKFCSLESCSLDGNDLDLVLSASTVAKMIEKALEQNPNYEIAFSGGTCSGEDRSAVYFSQICELVTKGRKDKNRISVEIAPPEKDIYIERLFNSGASALIMNIEIANEDERKRICPGKATIPLSRYIDAFKKAIDVFGKGNVSSVLIAGLQPADEVIDFCKTLISIGVVPTIIPFKPLNNSLMSEHEITDSNELLQIARKVGKLLISKGLFARKQSGCTKCGGCSLETVFQLAY
ncbi:MAG: hypothetical protein FWD38_06185 [Oscillospiraceae bacterium]|nr:hypothetical protein [Oscillospiraceae bacterium]